MCTLGGPPVAFALTGAKADGRTTLIEIFETAPGLVSERPNQTLIADITTWDAASNKSCPSQDSPCCVRPAGVWAARAGSALFRPLRHVIESINQIFKGQLDLGRHGGHTSGGCWYGCSSVFWH
ncbi:hypothetical protein GCM10027590_06600 [Nocardiopsis nanhaiensis]